MKVSIITIVYNNKEFVEDCITSVQKQTYKNIEHIIIDGNSKDGTQKVIEKYKNKLGFYISEKDNGLYDALNKGIKQASGDIIGILHSDDIFYNSEAVNKLVQQFRDSEADLVYGNGQYVDRSDSEYVKRIYTAKPFKDSYLKYGWIPLHTTIFVKKEIFRKYGLYDKEYEIAGDYEISLRWFTNNMIKKHFYNDWIVKMRLGGKSTSPKLQLKKSKEDLKIIKNYRLPGYFTLMCKIARKIPQYILPFVWRKFHLDLISSCKLKDVEMRRLSNL